MISLKMKLLLCLQHEKIKVVGGVLEIKVEVQICLMNRVYDFFLTCLDEVVLLLIQLNIEIVCNITYNINRIS